MRGQVPSEERLNFQDWMVIPGIANGDARFNGSASHGGAVFDATRNQLILSTGNLLATLSADEANDTYDEVVLPRNVSVNLLNPRPPASIPENNSWITYDKKPKCSIYGWIKIGGQCGWRE